MMVALEKTFGLDITSHALTAVEMAMTKTGPRVLCTSRVALEPGVVEDDVIIVNRELFRAALQQLLDKASPQPILSRNVIISVPENKTFAHRFFVPVERLKDHDFILQTAKDLIPIDLDEAIVDYKPLRAVQKGDREVELSFVATQKTIVESYLEILSEFGLNVVGIDVNTDSLVRACFNPLNPVVKDVPTLLSVFIGDDATVLSVRNRAGEIQTMSSTVSGLGMTRLLMEHWKITVFSEARKRLQESQEDGALSEVILPYFKPLFDKINTLLFLEEADYEAPAHFLYLFGEYAQFPALFDLLQKTFPALQIRREIDYLPLGKEGTTYFGNALGLSLRTVLPEVHAVSVNLMPYRKKQELENKQTEPLLLKYLLITFGVLLLVTGATGIFAGKAYLQSVTSEKELQVSIEKVSNPYLNEIVKTSQQKSELEKQLSGILEKDIPVSLILKLMNGYNLENVGIVNYSYSFDAASDMLLKLRAFSKSRADTEAYISRLDGDPFFTEVNSPLSNLAEKGERTIQIDLKVNKDKIREVLSAENEDAGSPSIPTASPNPVTP